ncbi:Hypothetical predicted protein [Mytilus galloprovincialis]|uniref:Uncharacterized protein n=1 Tax=Mytilus galloprovincialis TaxID=29158 RepID=A0A8B6GK56_MYTGA|nr:Hypothetical predicted protein [Mytilus galloprovincialis]
MGICYQKTNKSKHYTKVNVTNAIIFMHINNIYNFCSSKARPAEDVLSTNDKQKRKHDGVYVSTNKCWVKGRKLRRLQTGKAKSRKYLKSYNQWITQKDRHLIRRKQIRDMKRQKQEIQMHKIDSIGSMRRDVPIDRIKSIDEVNGYEHGKSFCRVSSEFRNIFENEYRINLNSLEAYGYTNKIHSFDDPMTDDLNLGFYRFGSTLLWTFPDHQITNDFNLGHTIPFESLAFSESILSYEISPFGHTRIIHPIEITLGHTNQNPACMLGHNRPF